MIDRDLARRIRFVGFDVDGVLTDGGIYLGAAGDAPIEFKRYDIQDGLGIQFLRDAGLHIAIVTGRVSESVRMRSQSAPLLRLWHEHTCAESGITGPPPAPAPRAPMISSSCALGSASPDRA